MKALQKQQQDLSSLSSARLPTARPSTAQGFSLPIRQVHSYGDSARIRTAREDHTDRSSRSSKQGTSVVAEPAIFITPEIEEAVKEWVGSLGLAHCLPQPKLPFTQDPFRNGILACELAQVLEKRRVEGSVLAPVTTTEIARNFEKALKAIQKAHPPAFNPAYYSLAPRLARGSDDTLWGFYWALYNAYPLVLPPHLEQVAHELPYDSVGIRRLESALLGWMESLGVLTDCEVPGSLIDLIPRMRTGYLICEVVRKALFVEIEEVFSTPKSEGAVLSNIRKALEVLKKYPEMSQKFVWSREKDISKGNLGVIMGLLEDNLPLPRWTLRPQARPLLSLRRALLRPSRPHSSAQRRKDLQRRDIRQASGVAKDRSSASLPQKLHSRTVLTGSSRHCPLTQAKCDDFLPGRNRGSGGSRLASV